MRKLLARVVSVWTGSTFGTYVATLVKTMSWRVALALALMLSSSVTKGAQLLLLVPLMQSIGLDVQQGSVGRLAAIVSSLFATVGLPPTLIVVLGVFVLVSVLLALITRLQTTFIVKFEQDFVTLMRRRLYRAIANTGWLYFARRRSSDFTHALTSELQRVGAATAYLLQLGANIVLLTIYAVFALRLSLAMTLLVSAGGVALLVLLRRKAGAARWTGEDISLATNGLYSAAIEHLASMKTTKSYGAEERNADLFSRLADRVAKMQLNAARNYAETAFWYTVGSTITLSILLYVAFEIVNLSAAGLLLLLLLFHRMVPLFGTLQRSYQELLNALPAFAGVMEMQARCEAAAEPRAERAKEIELREVIRFDEVTFAYDESRGHSAVCELDLIIGAGKTTAIVGPSGAGKSTVADLLMGLIVPGQGRVLVDGVPLSADVITPWRERIGYVAQDTFLFNDTIRANLLWARPETNDEEIERALRLAAAEFVLELPEGLDTLLGDRGVRFSGGERQRVALARALLREPSLLILDEATSALDSENEGRIQDAIKELHGRATILLITHRLSTVRDADVIHVLERGRLVESGRWGTLLDREGGRFGALARAQGIGQGQSRVGGEHRAATD
jgi:ATP-binding cassette, subfamily C, bacterial